jgi:hypothetical protein
MLPFDRRPWAPKLAKAVILFTIVAEIATFVWLRHYGPLDTGEILALVLVLVGVIPPNIHIIRRKPNEQLEDYTAPERNLPRRAERST